MINYVKPLVFKYKLDDIYPKYYSVYFLQTYKKNWATNIEQTLNFRKKKLTSLEIN